MLVAFTMASKSTSLFIPQLSMFLLFTGFSLNVTTTQLMIWNKTCLSIGYDKEICEHLHQHSEVEDDVQAQAASLNALVPVLTFIPAAFMTLVWGPLSDMYGRKPIIIIPAAASAISALGMLFQSLQMSLSPGILYSCSLLVGISGGLGTFMSTMISYVMDTTPPERRTEKMSLLLPAVALGQAVGTLCSGILWDHTGASIIYVLTFLANAAIVICVLYMQEVTKTNDADKNRLNGMFSMEGLWRNVTAGFRVVLANRKNGRQRKLLLLLIASAASVLLSAADATVVALHVRREPFQWTPSVLSYFAATKTVAITLGTALLAPLYNKVTGSTSDQGDLTLVGLGFGMSSVQCLVMYCATSSSHLFIIPLFGAFIGPIGPATRSLTSKLVLPSEIGALNGFTSFLNILGAAMGGLLLSSVYRETVYTLPGAAFLTSMTIAIFSLFVVLFLKNEFRVLPEFYERKSS